MRKILLVLLALLLPLSARAMTLPYPAETVLSVRNLTQPQQVLRDFLYDPVFRMDDRIELPKGTRYADVSAAMISLMQDYPEMFHLGKDYTVGYYRDTPELASWVEPSYRMSAEAASQARAVLYQQVYLIADAAHDAEALHDHLCAVTAYGGATEMRHTAVGALLEGVATCEGYAHALTLLYRMKGIPCGVVVGDATDSHGITGRHAWCVADTGSYTFIDPTWNDQDGLGLNTHWYYGLSTWQMSADHFPDADQAVPSCLGQDNWHARRGYVVSTQAEVDEAMRRLVQGETVNLRVASASLYQSLARGTFAYLEGYNQRCPQQPFYGSFTVSSCDAQGCVILWRVD